MRQGLLGIELVFAPWKYSLHRNQNYKIPIRSGSFTVERLPRLTLVIQVDFFYTVMRIIIHSFVSLIFEQNELSVFLKHSEEILACKATKKSLDAYSDVLYLTNLSLKGSNASQTGHTRIYGRRTKTWQKGAVSSPERPLSLSRRGAFARGQKEQTANTSAKPVNRTFFYTY